MFKIKRTWRFAGQPDYVQYIAELPNGEERFLREPETTAWGQVLAAWNDPPEQKPMAPVEAVTVEGDSIQFWASYEQALKSVQRDGGLIEAVPAEVEVYEDEDEDE